MMAGTASAETTVYGHVNKAVQRVNDGLNSYVTYVDNGTYMSRAGIKWVGMYDSCLKAGGHVQWRFDVNGTWSVSQDDQEVAGTVSFAVADAWITHSMLGSVYLGHGSEAVDGVYSTSKSNTWNTSYYAVSDLAAAMKLHEKGVGLSTITVGDAFINFEQFRANRVMYETPNLYGLSAKVAVANKDVDDKGGTTYERKDLTASVNYAVSYMDVDAELSVGMRSLPKKGDEDKKRQNAGFSVAAIHKPTGINVAGTFVSGRHQALDVTDSARKNTSSFYIQLGKQTTLMKYGSTNVAVDYYSTKHALENEDKANTFTLAVEQMIDKVDGSVYMAYRNYDYKTATTNYDKLGMFVFGVNFGFNRVI
jgi:hypothetical protein